MARRKKGNIVNGWLVIDKPKNMGSTDVVNFTRRYFNAQKNGHTGTLDPFATGVLPIAFVEATKLIPFGTDGKKEYEFVIKWGEHTASGDTETEVVETSNIVPTKDDILKIIPHFIGEIKQIPPAYSAIKIDGQRAYDLVRKGIDVDIPERIVNIYNLELLELLDGDMAKFRVECSKGTYVRTLGQDIAKSLGTIGHLKELRRTKCGVFDIKDTILLENLKNIVHSEALEKVLLSTITSLRDIAVIAVEEADAIKLKQGQSVSPKNYNVNNTDVAVAVFEDVLIAILRIDERRISPIRVFNFNDEI